MIWAQLFGWPRSFAAALARYSPATRWSRHDLVIAELARLHEHLLAPLGVATVPASPGQAITCSRAARDCQERRLRWQVSRTAEQAVSPATR